MNNFKANFIGVLTVVAIILAIVGIYLPAQHQASTLGGTTNYDTLAVTALQVGPGCNDSYGTCTGTTESLRLNGLSTGCISSAAPTINAQTTVTVDCPVTSVVAGDRVFVSAPSTIPSALVFTAAYASSTSGFITIRVYNAATTTTSIVGATSSIAYQVVR